MNELEAIETLRDVVESCAIMMPQAWRESHLADAKEAVETLAAKYKVEEIREAIDWFQEESLGCRIGLKSGVAGEAVREQLRHYTLAIEALSKELGNEKAL